MNTKRIHFNLRQLPARKFISLFLAVFATYLLGQPIAQAQNTPQAVSRIRRIYTGRWGMTNPGGVVYAPTKNRYYLAESNSQKVGVGKTALVTIGIDETLKEKLTLDLTLQDSSNLAVDEQNNRLLLLAGSQQELAQLAIGEDGQVDPTSLTRLNVAHWGVQTPAGMTVDTTQGSLLVLDAATSHVVVISLADGFDAAVPPLATIDLSGLGVSDLHGLAVHPQNGHLLLLSSGQQMIFELTAQGELLNRYTLAGMGLLNPRGIMLAPTADWTDDPTSLSLLVADQGLTQQESIVAESLLQLFLPWLSRHSDPDTSLFTWSNGDEIPDLTPNPDPGEIIDSNGKVVEISLDAPPIDAPVRAALLPLTLVNTIRAFAFAVPSTDSSGIANLPDPRNRLVIVDGEVDETNSFRGSNLFESKRSGAFTRAGSTLSYSREPTGADYNPSTGKLYISDDNADAVFEVTIGADGNFGTADDTSRKIDLSQYSIEDAEGVAVSPSNGAIFVVDGLTREIYRLHPMGDGRLGTADDQLTHFDTARLGISDPEGIDLTANGTILLVGDNIGLMFEVSTAGNLVQTYDISASRGFHLAGITVGPASNGSGRTNYYIADRGVDNVDNPNENDGRIFEFTQN